MALYRKSKSEIQQFCQIQFSKHIVSTAVYLGKGLWTILVTEPENLKNHMHWKAQQAAQNYWPHQNGPTREIMHWLC